MTLGDVSGNAAVLPVAAVPSNTPETAIPAQVPQPLNLISKGFGQKGRQAVIGFIVQNPNQSQAIESSVYQVALYDNLGTVMKTSQGYLTLLLPGQKVGQAVSVFLDSDSAIDHVDVQVKPGRFQASDPVETFSVDKTTYRTGTYSNRVTGLVKSPYQKDLTELQVSVLAYDGSGTIIGGGVSFLSFVPAKGQAAVDVPVTTSKAPAKVEIFPVLSGLSVLTAASAAPADAQPIKVVGKGFGQSGSTIAYAFLVTNPNQKYALERSQYQAVAYDSDGAVLRVNEGFLTLLLPGQQLGEAGQMLSDDKTAVARLDVEIEPGTYTATDPLPGFSSTNVAFKPGTYSSSVTGLIKNP